MKQEDTHPKLACLLVIAQTISRLAVKRNELRLVKAEIIVTQRSVVAVLAS